MTEEAFEEYLKHLAVDSKEVYIIDREGIIRQIVDEPWAKDAENNTLNTYYEIRANSIVQVVVSMKTVCSRL